MGKRNWGYARNRISYQTQQGKHDYRSVEANQKPIQRITPWNQPNTPQHTEKEPHSDAESQQ